MNRTGNVPAGTSGDVHIQEFLDMIAPSIIWNGGEKADAVYEGVVMTLGTAWDCLQENYHKNTMAISVVLQKP